MSDWKREWNKKPQEDQQRVKKTENWTNGLSHLARMCKWKSIKERDKER